MNRLLFVTLIVLLVISLTGASEEEEEENGENSLKENDVSEIIQRSTREAKKRNKNQKKNKNKNKDKKRRNNKAKRNRNKKSNKKTNKSKKRNNKRSKSSKKKNRKMKNRRSKKKNGKSKKNKGKKMGKKMGRKTFSRATNSSSSCNCTCLANAMTYLKMMKDKVSNYMRQKKRIEKQNSTAGNKSGKKGLFGPALQRLADAGGGNKSNLSCQGSITSSGALQLANISAFLGSCSKNIHAACDPSSLPLPSNMTKVIECNTDMTSFQSAVKLCGTQSGSAACTCWGGSTLKTLATKIKNCSLTTEINAMKAALNKCKGNFTICRKYEDDVVSAISSCSKSTTQLLQQAKALTDNAAGITKAINKTTSLSSNSTRRRERYTRATATSCAEIITKNNQINTLVGQNSASTKISTLALEVSGSNVTSCSSRSEKTQVAAQVTTLSASLTTTNSALTVIQANLKTQTGSTASSANIAAATTASSSSVGTTKTYRRLRRRRIIL